MKTAQGLAAALVGIHACVALGAGDYRQYKPPKPANAECHLDIKFLPEARDWERLVVYVPKGATESKLPCIVSIYGGGWGGKVVGEMGGLTRLLENGYVVAMPDYVLGAQQPVPMAVWDGAAALRFLRANAAKYRIDPERIGIIGLSAGGWLAQYLAPSDTATIWKEGRRGTEPYYVPMVEPHPANAGFSPLPVAFVTDWGAGFLARNLMNQGHPWIGTNDPPMFTCVTIPEGTMTGGVKAYRDGGAIAEIGYTYTKSKTTGEPEGGRNPNDYGHCLVGVNVNNVWTKDPVTGKEITFGDRTLQFIDQYVKNPKRTCVPEIYPHGGYVFQAADVVLRSVHPDARIYYTLDGSDPAEKSAVYRQPVPVKPGMTLKAMAVKSGLQASAVVTAPFLAAPCPPPVIANTQQVYRAKIGETFSVPFQAKSERPVTWCMSGKIEAKALEAVDTNKDSSGIKREGPWLTLDPKTGVLSGTPSGPGVSVFIVAANVVDGQAVLCDARSVIVVVSPPPAVEE